MDKYERFIMEYEAYYEKHKQHLRKGQALSNYLLEYCKDTAKQIDYTEYDCFYNDDIVPLTLSKLKELWRQEVKK